MVIHAVLLALGVFLFLKIVVNENLLNNKTVIMLNLAEYPLT